MPSNKELMLNCELYDPSDEVLVQERLSCKDLCHEYNFLKPSDAQKRKELLQKLLGKTKNDFLIEQSFWCDYGYNIEIGENFYSNHNLVILDPAKVTFGDNVFIGPNCSFYTPLHPLAAKERNKGFEYAKPITVGSNVWFGGGVTVLPDVTIGNNCTIGAGSLVTHNIPDNSLAIGSPCRVIKRLD